MQGCSFRQYKFTNAINRSISNRGEDAPPSQPLPLNLFIIMRAPKSRQHISSVNKSHTTINLPGISKTLKCSETERKPNRLSYLDTINSLSENVEYGDKSAIYLTKEQSKLKEMLRKMNDDTMQIIDTILPKKKALKATREELGLLTDRQIENSRKNISIMQQEIEKLQEKYTRIAEQSQEEEITSSILAIKQQIEEIRTSNIDIQLAIGKDGKEIVKQYSEGYDFKLTVLENDKVMFDQRFEKLKNDNSRIVEESSKIQTHLKDVDERMRELEGEYQNAKNCTLAETMNKNREMTMRERTYQMSSGRKRMEFQNNHLQYKYYKLLKELEVKKTTCDDLGHREEGVLGKLSRSKDEISTLEAELERMRRRKEEKNRSVLQFVEKERRRNRSQFSDLGDSMLIPRAISSIEPTQSAPKVDLEIEDTRKWQSEPYDETSQKIIETQMNNEQNSQMSKVVVHQDLQNISTIEMKQPTKQQPKEG